jgi:Mg2+ and Co2+ transporter CorA
MAVEWDLLVNPSKEEADDLVGRIDVGTVDDLHTITKRHLMMARVDAGHAFPRCEVHYDTYLFGQLQLPTALDDGLMDFLELTFVATFDNIWSVLRFPGVETELVTRFRDRLSNAMSKRSRAESAGDILGRIITIVVSELEEFFAATDSELDGLEARIRAVGNDRHLSRSLKDVVPEIDENAADLRREIASLGTVVDQLDVVVHDVATNATDLRSTDADGREIELFGPSTEIYLQDAKFRTKRLRKVQDEQIERTAIIKDRITQLRGADEVTSGRFMGAIASIMLFPTFVVGMYGMNFDTMPELHMAAGYAVVVGIIVVSTLLQVWIFRRRRWL